MSRPYLQHGRRHSPQGSDPIPNITSEFMLAYGQIIDSSVSPVYADLDLWVTSNDSVFTLELGTGGLSAKHGIAIHEEGIYRAWSTWTVNSGTNGDILVGDLDVTATGVSFWQFANTQNFPANQVTFSGTFGAAQRIHVGSLIYVGGPLQSGPVTLPALIFANALSQGGNAYNIEFETIVERLATSYTTNGAVGTAP